jgi:hypothetical protein
MGDLGKSVKHVSEKIMKHRAPWLGIVLAAIPLVLGGPALAATQFVRQVVDRGPAGRYNSQALNPQGDPRISYWGDSRQDLRFASKDAGTWTLETADSTAVIGLHTSLALDAAGELHVSYWDATHGDLKYASHAPAGWTIETVDSVGVVGEYTSLALDATGRPHISYYDATIGDLMYASGSVSSWTLEIVDGSGDVGRYTSLRWTRAVTLTSATTTSPTAVCVWPPGRAAWGSRRWTRGTTSAAMLRSRSTARAILSSAISTPRAATSSTRAARRGSGAPRP